MPTQNAATVAIVGVWDTSANDWKTGDAANITLKVVADGTAGTIAGSVSEVDATNQPGRYKLTVAAGENTGLAMEVSGKSSTANCVVVPDRWDNLPAAGVASVAVTPAAADILVVHSGTAAAGGSTTITLASTALAVTDYYTGCWVSITGGTGSGQIRRVTDYTSARVATVASAWSVTPDATSTYEIGASAERPNPRVDASAISGDSAAADNLEAGYDGTGYAAANSTIGTVTTLTNDPTGVGTLLTRLSAARAGYLDNLSAGAAALEATLTAIKGAGWSNETLAAMKTVLDTAAADVANIDGDAMRGTDGAELSGAAATAVATLNDLSSVQAQAAAAAALAAYGASTYAGGDTSGVTTLLDRLTAARAGYLDELGSANLPADVDALKTYCDVLDDATNGLAAIKALLVTAAGDVAGLDGSAMLSAATVKSALEAAGSHLALIKAVTDTLSGAATAGVFSAEALANAPGGTLTAEAIDTQLSGTHGSGAWGGSAGSGAYTVTVTVQTSGGTVYEGVRVSVNNTSETASPLVAYTNSSGQAVFYLDAGSWRAIAAANSAQSGGATNVTVDGAESVTVTVTAVTVPAATSADNYVLYGYGRKAEADAAFGASGLSVEIVRIEQAAQYDATANATRHIMGTSYATDATGLWSLEIAKALAGTRLDLKFSWTDADSVTRTETWYATIAASAANESDQIAWADLSPVRKS